MTATVAGPMRAQVVTSLPATATLGDSLVLSSTGHLYTWDGSSWVDNGAGGGGGAPTTASYVTMALDATLTSERVLTAGAGISITDGGAGGPVTIAATGGGAPTGASYVVMSADGTLTSERILTAGTGISITDGGAGNPVTVSCTIVVPTYLLATLDFGTTPTHAASVTAAVPGLLTTQRAAVSVLGYSTGSALDELEMDPVLAYATIPSNGNISIVATCAQPDGLRIGIVNLLIMVV